jgi:hypothetical protein
MGTNKIYVIILLLILTNLVSNCNRINKDKCTTEKIITRYGNFQAYRSLEDGIRIANECKKEILLIFSCYSCYSAKDLEWAQLSNTRIKEILDKKWLFLGWESAFFQLFLCLESFSASIPPSRQHRKPLAVTIPPKNLYKGKSFFYPWPSLFKIKRGVSPAHFRSHTTFNFDHALTAPN